MGHGCPVSNGSGNYHYVYEKSQKYPIETSGIDDVCAAPIFTYIMSGYGLILSAAASDKSKCS